jgi:hypothetical protein
MLKHTIAAAAAAGAALLLAAPAFAAQATASVNVRSGPGTSYRVVDTLRPGEEVDIGRCVDSGWCEISHSGPDGWVSRNYLSDSGRGPGPRPGGNGPDVNFSINTPNFSFSIGNGFNGRPPPYWGRPGFPGRAGQVCFYEDWNFRGRSFCVRSGQDARLTGRWNDAISSIRVTGNAQAQVCEDWNFRGRCAVIGNSQPRLSGRNNDIISSYRVR